MQIIRYRTAQRHTIFSCECKPTSAHLTLAMLDCLLPLVTFTTTIWKQSMVRGGWQGDLLWSFKCNRLSPCDKQSAGDHEIQTQTWWCLWCLCQKMPNLITCKLYERLTNALTDQGVTCMFLFVWGIWYGWRGNNLSEMTVTGWGIWSKMFACTCTREIGPPSSSVGKWYSNSATK